MPADSRLGGNQSRQNVNGTPEDASVAQDGGRSSALPADRQGKSHRTLVVFPRTVS